VVFALAISISTSQECRNPKFGRKMSFEIEHKFLVLSDGWRNFAIRRTKIRQAYLDSNAKVSIRVRIKDDSRDLNSQISLVVGASSGV
jgi:CYTH domain-containing protein